MEYSLTRTNRKTAAIYVRNGGIEVRAPLRMPKRDVDKFILSKEKWIQEKLEKSLKQVEQRNAFELNFGDSVMLRGLMFPLVMKSGVHAGFDGEIFYMPPDLSSEKIKTICVYIYCQLAKEHLTSRTLFYKAIMGAPLYTVKINGAKTRWGSCSAKRNINFSWRLMMADDSVIDYVVVHELAHLFVLNHSKQFWAIVRKFMPDYQERISGLHHLREKLAGENW